MIMPSVPGKDGMPERSVLRSVLSALAFESRRSSRSPMKLKKKKRAKDCLGRLCEETEDETVADGDSTDQNYYGGHQHQPTDADAFGPNPQLQCVLDLEIFYDAIDRGKYEESMDEDLIPIGLEPDDSVMMESFEAYLRDERSSTESSSLRHYHVPLEAKESGSLDPSCSSLSISEAPPKEAPEAELPLRFLRAGKGDPVEGRRRYEATLKWRKDHDIDSSLYRAWPHFDLIKKHYPHFFHCKGKHGEPVFFEQPPKTDLKSIRQGGVDVKTLLKHYAMVTEFQWQYLSRDDNGKSIYIIDLDGIRMTDFMGECVDFVRQASEFTGQNYPERAGYVFVINVPGWFKIIWNVVKPMVDEVTLQKIYILKGKDEIFTALSERIDIENIPQEYGGQSCYKLGESPEEELLSGLMRHNNALAQGIQCCSGKHGNPPCQFCTFEYARHY